MALVDAGTAESDAFYYRILTGPDIKIHLELATFFTQKEVASSHQTALKLPVLRTDNFFKFVQIELVDANPLPASTITFTVIIGPFGCDTH